MYPESKGNLRKMKSKLGFSRLTAKEISTRYSFLIDQKNTPVVEQNPFQIAESAEPELVAKPIISKSGNPKPVQQKVEDEPKKEVVSKSPTDKLSAVADNSFYSVGTRSATITETLKRVDNERKMLQARSPRRSSRSVADRVKAFDNNDFEDQSPKQSALSVAERVKSFNSLQETVIEKPKLTDIPVQKLENNVFLGGLTKIDHSTMEKNVTPSFKAAKSAKRVTQKTANHSARTSTGQDTDELTPEMNEVEMTPGLKAAKESKTIRMKSQDEIKNSGLQNSHDRSKSLFSVESNLMSTPSMTAALNAKKVSTQLPSETIDSGDTPATPSMRSALQEKKVSKIVMQAADVGNNESPSVKTPIVLKTPFQMDFTPSRNAAIAAKRVTKSTLDTSVLFPQANPTAATELKQEANISESHEQPAAPPSSPRRSSRRVASPGMKSPTPKVSKKTMRTPTKEVVIDSDKSLSSPLGESTSHGKNPDVPATKAEIKPPKSVKFSLDLNTPKPVGQVATPVKKKERVPTTPVVQSLKRQNELPPSPLRQSFCLASPSDNGSEMSLSPSKSPTVSELKLKFNALSRENEMQASPRYTRRSSSFSPKVATVKVPKGIDNDNKENLFVSNNGNGKRKRDDDTEITSQITNNNVTKRFRLPNGAFEPIVENTVTTTRPLMIKAEPVTELSVIGNVMKKISRTLFFGME
ncbi:hypothetical protein BC833DRAFT_582827 [Globomyces pollinis-pini]|nr:hypothetical protein BC833DRAFT_582827 [Globomyces pollinis-pini]